MGLDMYLTAKRYVWKHNGSDSSLQDGLQKVMKKEMADLDFDVKEVAIDAMYWRKANAIHRWFVENVQDGEDDCREYWVDPVQLEALVNDCYSALENIGEASEVLPTQGGFFFGSTEYDEWYFRDLKETIKGLEKVLKLDSNKWDFYYRSSW